MSSEQHEVGIHALFRVTGDAGVTGVRFRRSGWRSPAEHQAASIHTRPASTINHAISLTMAGLPD